MNEELLIEILKQYRARYNHVNEIQRLTRELGDALSRNDKASVQILLGMRGEEMEAADVCLRNIHMLSESADKPEQLKLEPFLTGPVERIIEYTDVPNEQDKGWINKIIEVRQNINKVLKETVAVDKIVNRKLSGDNSYYKKSPV